MQLCCGSRNVLLAEWTDGAATADLDGGTIHCDTLDDSSRPDSKLRSRSGVTLRVDRWRKASQAKAQEDSGTSKHRPPRLLASLSSHDQYLAQAAYRIGKSCVSQGLDP
jgi:hypothetical protein